MFFDPSALSRPSALSHHVYGNPLFLLELLMFCAVCLTSYWLLAVVALVVSSVMQTMNSSLELLLGITI